MNEIKKELLKALNERKRPYDIRNELMTLEYSGVEIDACLANGIPDDENAVETRQWRTIFSFWENAEGKWTEETPPCSKKRRDLIFSKLGIEGTSLFRSLIKSIPLNELKRGPAVISGKENHEDWVQLSTFHEFGHWERYKSH